MPHRRAPSPKGARTVGLKEPTAISLRTCPFRSDFCHCGAPLVPDVVQRALRPYRPYRVPLARSILAPPGGCAAVHRPGNNSSVLAVPRRMCVVTLSKCIPTSRSIHSALVISDIKGEHIESFPMVAYGIECPAELARW
jgi:hypothetical protein